MYTNFQTLRLKIVRLRPHARSRQCSFAALRIEMYKDEDHMLKLLQEQKCHFVFNKKATRTQKSNGFVQETR
jgi:hypothetical protein